MARIRTIKPEFQQSQSIGRVSRDARLTFVLLWPQCDDHGRVRADSRMLASVLFPYDKDAAELMEGWLTQLEGVGCIRRYVIDGYDYLEIPKWLEHQRVDHPQKSKYPSFREDSRIFANAREQSRVDQGSRIKERTKDAIFATEINSDSSSASFANGNGKKELKKMNGHSDDSEGWKNQAQRDAYARDHCIPFLPGRDDNEKRKIAFAAENPDDPNYKFACSEMRKAAKLAGVGWKSPHLRTT